MLSFFYSVLEEIISGRWFSVCLIPEMNIFQALFILMSVISEYWASSMLPDIFFFEF